MLKKKLKFRYDWVDVLKFLGIFYIFLGHYGEQAGVFYYFSFRFHVPLFFFVSGFFFKNDDNVKFFDYLKEKFKKIMIPYFVFSFIHIVFLSINNSNNLYTIISWLYCALRGIRNNIVTGSAWFLPCLFVMYIMYYLLNKIFNNKYLILFLSILIYYLAIYKLPQNPIANPSMIWNIDSALVYLVYFSIGNVFFHFFRNFEYKKLTICGKISLVVFGVIEFLFTIKILFTGTDFLGSYLNEHFIYTINLLVAMLLITFHCIIAYIIRNVSLFQEIGKDTLLICCNEQMSGLLVKCLLDCFSIKLNLATPLITIMYSSFMLFLTYKYFVPISKKILLVVQNKIYEIKDVLYSLFNKKIYLNLK